jgi:hypothetical protein
MQSDVKRNLYFTASNIGHVAFEMKADFGGRQDCAILGSKEMSHMRR